MKKNKRPGVRFEEGSKQPMLLFFIGVIIVCSVIVIASLATSGLSFTLSKNLSKGDVNSDKKLDSGDALKIILREKGNIDFNGSQIDAADIDGNGSINYDDAVMIVQYSTGEVLRLGNMIKQSEPDAVQVISPDVNRSAENSDTLKDNENKDGDTARDNETDAQQEQSEPEYSLSGLSEGTAYVTGENEIYYTARVSNSWVGENGKTMNQIDFTVKNNSDKTIYYTTADVTLSDDALIEKTHNCSVNENDSGGMKVTVKNAVMPFGSYKCSFIVSSISEVSVAAVDKQAD